MEATGRLWILVLACLVLPASGRAAEPDRSPWRLNDAIRLPPRLSIEGDQRTRYEYIHGQLAAGFPGNQQILALRTRIRVGVAVTDWLALEAELQDSRAYLADTGTPVGTSHVNAAELLRAYLQLSFLGSHSAKLGRLTMDVGSRRLVARNRFRNTSNAFTGLEWNWLSEEGHELRGFYALPIQRLPSDTASLLDNDVEFDKESFKVQFFGLFYTGDHPWGGEVELYGFGLHERDSSGRPTRNRRLGTPGFRLVRDPRTGGFDYEWETALQFGRARTPSSSTRDLDVFAHFHHLALGYTFDAPLKPRVILHYDYGSGDDDPTDGRYQRFDTLYGARRFEFGPTSLYGAFQRSNINTPGIRFEVRPRSGVSSFIDYRAVWLASARDEWVPNRVRDASGQSGKFVGSQIELRVRWWILPSSVLLEVGYAHLFAGEFIDEAPNSNQQGDTDYIYTQVNLNF